MPPGRSQLYPGAAPGRKSMHSAKPQHTLAFASRLLVFCFLSFCASQVEAQTRTWTGNGGNVNWTNAGNWGGVSWNGSPTTDVVFAGTTNTGTAGTPLNQNISGPLKLNSLTFSAGGGAFYLDGSPLRIDGTSNSITQNSSSAESIGNDISPKINSTVNLSLTGDGTGLVTISGRILDGNAHRDYAILKNGTSMFALSGANTYTGGTTINAGSLFANNTSGSGTGTGNVTVNGGTFGGKGTITGALKVLLGANLAPGQFGIGSTAILRTGSLTLSSGSNFVLDLNSTTVGTGYDQISVIGTVNITGSNLVISPGAGLSLGDKFFIVANNGTDAVNGTFSSGATVTAGLDTFMINYADSFSGAGVGNDISLTLIAVLPETSTWTSGLIAGAIAIAHGMRVRSHRRRQADKT